VTQTATSTPPYVLAGSFGNGTLQNPSGVRYTAGNLWIADNDTNILSQWTTTGTEGPAISTFNSGSFDTPSGVGIGPDGYVYVADGMNARVEEFDPSGNYVGTFGSAELGGEFAQGVAVGAASAYLLDYSASNVIQYAVGGTGSTKTFTSPVTFSTASSGPLGYPYNLCFDTGGNVYVADHGNGRIVKFDAGGNYLLSFTLPGTNPTPADMVVDGSGNVFALDDTNGLVVEFDGSGNVINGFGQSVLSQPQGIDIDPLGDLYVGDVSNGTIYVFTKN